MYYNKKYSYSPFPLEIWISRYYRSLGILEPADLNLKFVARAFRIFLTYTDKRCYSFKQGRFMTVNINNNLDTQKQIEVFHHELCHLLRHEGYQYKMMPAAFRELQERDARHFTKYAAIPFHMLSQCDFRSPTIVQDLSEVFNVSEELAQYRVDHIYRNLKVKS